MDTIYKVTLKIALGYFNLYLINNEPASDSCGKVTVIPAVASVCP
jgi:hypothetical protein